MLKAESIMVRAMKFVDEPVCIGRLGRHKEPPWNAHHDFRMVRFPSFVYVIHLASLA